MCACVCMFMYLCMYVFMGVYMYAMYVCNVGMSKVMNVYMYM